MSLKAKIKKRVNRIKKYLGFKVLLPYIYKKYSRKPLDEKLVVFADIRDRPLPDNCIGLWEMCRKAGYKCVELSGREFGEKIPPSKRKRARYKFKIKFMRLYAQARAVIMVEAFDMAYVAGPRPGTDLVQLWHACGLMKTMGYASPPKAWGLPEKERHLYCLHKNYTFVTASSEYVKWGYYRAFLCDPGMIKPIGIPRTDIYFDQEFREKAAAKVRSFFPEIGARKIVLYAPTFRGKNINSATTKKFIEWPDFKQEIGEKYALILKYHPQATKGRITERSRIEFKDFMFDATTVLTPEEALCAADILVTDYSSIMFEYLLLERPLISFIPDIDTYAGERGFFAPYDQLAPGPYVFDQDQLSRKIMTVDEWFDIERIRAYRKKFMEGCDGHSTERIFNYIFDREYREKYDNEYFALQEKEKNDSDFGGDI